MSCTTKTKNPSPPPPTAYVDAGENVKSRAVPILDASSRRESHFIRGKRIYSCFCIIRDSLKMRKASFARRNFVLNENRASGCAHASVIKSLMKLNVTLRGKASRSPCSAEIFSRLKLRHLLLADEAGPCWSRSLWLPISRKGIALSFELWWSLMVLRSSPAPELATAKAEEQSFPAYRHVGKNPKRLT